jgi:UDP-N-acetyl-D-glucosamine dehydrogenase
MTANGLQEKLQQRTARVAVIGLGYVGLPLIDAFFQAGYTCIGYDIDPRKVATLQRGECYIRHFGNERVAAWQASGRFEATVDAIKLRDADAIVVCVPTPLDQARDPDLQHVIGTARTIAEILRPGQLIVLESTTYPTTTRDVVLPILERSGLRVGEDFFLAYSPEREDPGNRAFSAAKIPKVVGGIEPNSLRLASALYRPAVVQTIEVGSCEVAEACKVLENIYRAVNIALVNELKVLFDRLQIDVWEVIAAAKTKPFGFQAFYPGPGLGGHCIPIDPFYLSWLARKAGMETRFIELAGEVNRAMPQYVIDRLTEALNDRSKPVRGSKVLLLGVAYKRDIDDPRESPSFVLLEKLFERGAVATYNDPHVPELPAMRHHSLPAMTSQELTESFLAAQDAVIIATDHSDYDYEWIVAHAPLVIDTRNATSQLREHRDRVVKA